MPRVNKPRVLDNLFKVTFTEYERGWGQRPAGEEYFDNEAEARQYAIDYNRKHNNLDSAPDWYIKADYSGRVA